MLGQPARNLKNQFIIARLIENEYKSFQSIVVPSTIGGLCVLMLSKGLEYGTRNVTAVLVRSFQLQTCFQDPSTWCFEMHLSNLYMEKVSSSLKN